MKNSFYDFLILGGISSILALWLITEHLQIGNPFLKLLWFLVPFFAWRLIINTHSKEKHYLVLNALLAISLIIWLFPVFLHPHLPLGKDFTKPFHDGMTLQISRHGVPVDNPEEIDIFDYPNAMHTLGGFFGQIGFPIMHANMAAILFALIIHTYALFLLLRHLYKDSLLAALFAGTSSLISFLIPYYSYLSPPQIFVSFLIIPSIYLFYRSMNNWKYSIGFALALGLITASYSGLSIFLIPLFIASAAAYFIYKKVNKNIKGIKNLAFAIILGIVLIGLVLAAQSDIYWDNVGGERNDCYDSSHYAFPLAPLVLFFFTVVAGYYFLKQKRFNHLLGMIVLVMVIILLSPIAYELIFQQLHPFETYEDCLKVDDTGLFGGWTHLRVHRVSFMQNFIFILLLPALPLAFKKKKMIAGVMIVVILFVGFNPLYHTEPVDGRYNMQDIHSSSPFQNEMTTPFFIYKSSGWIEKGWSPELVQTLDEIYPQLSDERKLVFVSYDKKQSFSHRWFIYLYLDKHYKYVLKPREFFEKYVYAYDFIISLPCKTEKIPETYQLIKEEEDFCVLEKITLQQGVS